MVKAKNNDIGKKRRPVTILSTASASQVVPSIFKCMRRSERFNYRIVAVDAMPAGVGEIFADAYHVVPFGNRGEQYISAVFDLCGKEKVDILLPISDEENLTLSAHKQLFEDAGIKVLCNNHETTKIALRKDLSLEILERNGVDVPCWKAPKSIAEFDSAIVELGYPDRDVVIKPTTARGSRGFRVIKHGIDEFQQLCQEKEEIYIALNRLRKMLQDQPEFPQILLMEYLSGMSLNIDIFADGGKAKCIVPHERRAYRWGFVDRAHLKPHPEACAMCRDIVDILGFDNLVNIELNENENGLPRLIEINPRASATLALNQLAGLNILDMATAAALGEPLYIPEKFINVEYILYWEPATVPLGESSLC